MRHSKKRINQSLKQMQDRQQEVEEIARLERGIAQCELELQSYVSAEERSARPTCWPNIVTISRKEWKSGKNYPAQSKRSCQLTVASRQ